MSVCRSFVCVCVLCVCLRAVSGDAFRKAAELHLLLDTKHEAASCYTEAAQVLKRDDPQGRAARGGVA